MKSAEQYLTIPTTYMYVFDKLIDIIIKARLQLLPELYMSTLG